MAWTLLAALALVVLQLRLLDGFWNHIDIHLYDGVVHVMNGKDLFDGHPPDGWLAWAPVLATCYGLLGAAGVPLLAQQDTMAAAVSVAGTFALWFAVRPIAGAAPSLLVAASWTGTPLALHRATETVPSPTQMLAAVLCWLGVGLALRARWWIAATLFAVAAVERGEIVLPLAAAGLVACIVVRPRRRGLLLLGATVAAACFHQSYEHSRNRAWLTFRQHYAGAALVRGDGVAGASFGLPDTTIARDFPGATSLSGVAAVNPAALAHHVAWNVTQLPGTVSTLLFQPFGHTPWLRWSMLALAGALIAWIGLRRAARVRRLLHAHRTALGILAVGAAVTLLPQLLLMPRADLLLPGLPFAAALAAVALRAAMGRERRWRWPVLGVVVVAALAAPGPFGSQVSGLREGRAGLKLIQRQQLAPDERLGTIWAPLSRFIDRPNVAPVSLDHLGLAGDQAAFDADFAAASPTLVVVAPRTFGECGPRAPFLAHELAADHWEIVDGFFPVLLYRRVR
ncbi:MAG TPA: hypothetical protein VFT55_04130 [Planctomycetota bacterium]|nr:hypothetical protein [Planctomycetota bacterium]